MYNLDSIRWDIAQKCNLNCKHCQTGDHRSLNYYETNTEEAKIIVDKLYKEKVSNVGLLGGEPLLRRDIKDLVSYMNSKGMKVTINTNGLLMNRKLIEFLFSQNVSIIVSLDGASETTHEYLRGRKTFNRTLEKIRLAVEVKRNMNAKNIIGLSIVLHQQNKTELLKLIDLATDLGVDYLTIQSVYRTGNADQYWDTLSLSGEEIIELGKEFYNIFDREIPFHLDERVLTNKALKYLNETQNRSFKYKFVGDGDGYTNAYIRCDGVMFPSAGLLSMHGEFPQNNLIKNEIRDIYKSDIYIEWRELTSKKLYKSYYTPCNTCEFSGISCFPTPNAYMMNKESPLEICNYIESLNLTTK